MNSTIDIGKISSRGQIAIPSDIRTELGLSEGSKVLFFTENDTLLIKKITSKTFAEITKPIKSVVSRSGLKETGVDDLVHRARKK
jgi:AbrB family looped-hinge helix DNA binding protein